MLARKSIIINFNTKHIYHLGINYELKYMCSNRTKFFWKL